MPSSQRACFIRRKFVGKSANRWKQIQEPERGKWEKGVLPFRLNADRSGLSAAVRSTYMLSTSSHDVTRLLKAWNAGEESALEKLIPLIYGELHRAAQRYMARERSEHTLQTTALINETYLRLVDFQHISWQNRAQFFGICAQLMRRILVDFARSRGSKKRGADGIHLPLQETLIVSREPRADLIALDDALKALAAIDERKSRVIELRFFGGLSVRETAEVLKVSDETVKRDWRLAKVWLLRQFRRESS
jgi:RNA polymerase sigma factor (TIGR02999 family)